VDGAVAALRHGESVLGPSICVDRDKAAEYRFSLADMLLSLGRKPEAEVELTRGLATSPATARAHEALALLLEERGHRATALRHYATAARIASTAPQRPYRMNYVAALLKSSAPPPDRRRGAAMLRAVVGTGFRADVLCPDDPAAATTTTATAFNSGPTLNRTAAAAGDAYIPYAEYGARSCLHGFMPVAAGGGGPDSDGGKWAARPLEGLGVSPGCRARVARARAAAAREAVAALGRLQNPGDCGRARGVVVAMEHDELGFAASFHMLVLAMQALSLTPAVLSLSLSLSLVIRSALELASRTHAHAHTLGARVHSKREGDRERER
jgi:tetratricopeptide (TPR) repeat protein